MSKFKENEEYIDDAFRKDLEKLLDAMDKAQGEVSVKNISRQRQFEIAYKFFESEVSHMVDAKIWRKDNYPYTYMSNIYIEAKKISFTNCLEFCNIVSKCADTFDIAPKTNGKVVMTIGFYGMTEVLA